MTSTIKGMLAAMSIAGVGGLAGRADAGVLPEAPVLWGVASFAPFTTQSLYRINPTTGQAVLVGSTGLTQIGGLAFNAAENRMYALTINAELYTVNLYTGATQLVADANRILGEGDAAFVGSTLHAIDGLSLATVDTITGSVSEVGAMGPAANDISGLAWTGSTLLGYSKNGSAEDSLVSINTGSGVATTIGLTGINTPAGVGGLAFDAESGVTFLTDGSSLYTVNTLTGAATFVGAHGVSGFSGLAIPAPGAAGLIAGLGLLASRRRR